MLKFLITVSMIKTIADNYFDSVTIFNYLSNQFHPFFICQEIIDAIGVVIVCSQLIQSLLTTGHRW